MKKSVSVIAMRLLAVQRELVSAVRRNVVVNRLV